MTITQVSRTSQERNNWRTTINGCLCMLKHCWVINKDNDMYMIAFLHVTQWRYLSLYIWIIVCLFSESYSFVCFCMSMLMWIYASIFTLICMYMCIYNYACVYLLMYLCVWIYGYSCTCICICGLNMCVHCTLQSLQLQTNKPHNGQTGETWAN